MAVLTSSYCKALAAKRQYFWACSFSCGVRVAVVVLLGWTGTSAATVIEGGTDGWEGWKKYKAHSNFVLKRTTLLTGKDCQRQS